MSEEITRMPAVALRGMTILPSMIVHFDVSRDKSIKAIEQAMTADQKLFVVTQRDPEASDPGIDDLYHIGTVVEIKQLVKLPKNIIRVLVEGLERAELLEMEASAGYLDAKVATFPDVKDQDYPGKGDEVGQQAMIRNLKELFQKYAQANGKISQELVRQIMEIEDLEHLTDQIAIHIPLYYEEKQRILEAVFLYDRYEELCVILANEENIMRIKVQLQEKVKARIDKNQKEYILREQLKLIREELGDDTTLDDAQHFLEETEKLTAGEEVKEKIRKEIKRFSNSAGNTSEAGVIRGYIETLLEMPWDKMSEDNEDISAARKQLDQDHYGLEKVKERVLEFLAVRTLTRKGDSPILCLVGPPGTGKTSIAKSIAEALNKQYVRICLGGVRDEAEIRGHRRTYVGAMPGRIANGLKMAGVKNPLMLLDEVDKVSSDYKGDTSSALLEVLDPEQNVRFRDHYIEIPVDLSEVLFIATANDVQGIPRPLLDRMELIEISSYTENEKLHIAKEHLLKKQIRKHGLENYTFTVSDGALKKMITSPSVSKVKHVMQKDPISVHVDTPIDEVAQIIEKYDLVAIPVLDSIGRLVGQITVDDVMDEVREQSERDYQLASGLSQDVETDDNVLRQTTARLPWLLIGMIGGIGNSMILGNFDATFAAHPEMALYIPLIGGTGGNVGTQSSAIIVQGLANSSLDAKNTFKQVTKEAVVALINATIISLLVYTYNFIRFGATATVTYSVSISLFAVVMFASIFGTLVPMTLEKLKIDPAIATGPFIAITNDIIGMMLYMGITVLLS